MTKSRKQEIRKIVDEFLALCFEAQINGTNPPTSILGPNAKNDELDYALKVIDELTTAAQELIAKGIASEKAN